MPLFGMPGRVLFKTIVSGGGAQAADAMPLEVIHRRTRANARLGDGMRYNSTSRTYPGQPSERRPLRREGS